jgi:hypothetical protein
MGNGEAPVA